MAEGGFAQEYKPSYGATSSEPLPDVSFAGSHYNQTEISQLCENITTKVYTINSGWKQLQQASKTIGTSNDSQGLRDKVHVTQMSTNQIIGQTTKDIQRLTELARKGRSDKQQKFQIDRLTSRFKEAVNTYSTIQKQVADKMKFCLLPSEVAQENDDVLINIDDDQKLLSSQRQAVIRDVEFEQGLLLEREQRVKQIEGDIIDVNQIMRELGAMVHQQAESIDTIENSIENVQVGVQSAEQELEKAAAYQNKRRKSVLTIALISLLSFFILVFLIYLSLK